MNGNCNDGNNGGCSHFCAESVCSCPPCWSLNEDGKTCSIASEKAFVTCRNDGMEVVIDKCVVPQFDQNLVHLRSSECAAVEEDDSYFKVSSGFSDCGTEIQFYDNNFAISNVLMIEDHEIGFTCRYNNVASATKSSIAETVVFDINEEAPTELSFSFKLQQFESDEYATEADLPTGSVQIGSLIRGAYFDIITFYMRVSREMELPESLEFSVHQCSVEDTATQTEVRILDSCPVFPAVYFQFKNDQSNQNTVDFSVAIFKFRSSAEIAIIELTCNINICFEFKIYFDNFIKTTKYRRKISNSVLSY